MLRLVEYWLDLESSREAILSESGRAYGFAVWYGSRFANNRMRELVNEVNAVDYLDAPRRPRGRDDSTRTLGDHTPSTVDVEELALSDDPDVLLSEFLDVALADSNGRWTVPLMQGETVAAQGRREGIAHQTVSTARERACARLRPIALDLGLAG